MRAFIAVDFSSELKSEIADLQLKLKTHASSGRWKYIDNFHLTLKFLDEINTSQVENINRSLKEICGRTKGFKLNISELGNFPGRGSLRVLWLGLGGDIGKLNTLQKDIDTSLQSMGFQSENRRYTPHVTIGQDLVFDMDFDSIRRLADLSEFPGISADRIYLFKSEQVANKRIYTPVNEFRLMQD